MVRSSPRPMPPDRPTRRRPPPLRGSGRALRAPCRHPANTLRQDGPRSARAAPCSTAPTRRPHDAAACQRHATAEVTGRCSARSAMPAAQRRNRPGTLHEVPHPGRSRGAADRHAIRRGARLRRAQREQEATRRSKAGENLGLAGKSRKRFRAVDLPTRFRRKRVRSPRAPRSAAPGTRPAPPARRARWSTLRSPAPTASTAGQDAPSTTPRSAPNRPAARTARPA